VYTIIFYRLTNIGAVSNIRPPMKPLCQSMTRSGGTTPTS
jgi:hypothetical protein